MSTTITLNTATLCEYKTGTLGPYTIQNSNARVIGSIHWTYKNKKISFYFKATDRQQQAYRDSSSYTGYVWYGADVGYVRIGVNGSYTGRRAFVAQRIGGRPAPGGGWQDAASNYDTSETKTINATTSTITINIGFSSSDETIRNVSFTPSKNTMVSTLPSIEYYRDGASVKARVSCVTTRSSTTYSDSYAYAATITINGSSQSVNLTIPSSNTSSTNTSSWLTVTSTANSVTATVTISSSNGGAYSSTQTATLNVPAMSSISGNSTGTLGSDYTINITRYDSTFTDTLTYIIGGTTIATIASGITGSTSSYTWSAPPISLASYATTATTLVVTIRCTTKSGTTTIGSTDMAVTFSIPSSVKPTLGTVTLTKVNSNTTVNGWGIYLQGYSQCGISITGSAGVYGSTLTSYTVKVGGVEVSGSGSSGNANWTGTSAVINSSGTISVSISLVDSRGRTATSTQNITVYQYSYPTATNTVCHRTDTSTSSAESDDGTYIYMYAVASYSSANSHNAVTMTIKWRQTGSGSYGSAQTVTSGVGKSYGGGNISVASAYDVVLTITDTLGNGNTYTFSLPTGLAAIHVKEGGTGICFGGYSTHDDSVELGPDMKLILGSGAYGTSLPSSGINGQVFYVYNNGRIEPYLYNSGWRHLSYVVYDSVVQLGKTSGEATIVGSSGVYAAMEDRSILITSNTEFATGVCPSYGIVVIVKRSGGRSSVNFYGATNGDGDFRMYISNNAPTGTWIFDGTLYYTSQAVSVASSAQIMRIPASGTDSRITANTVVLSCVFARPDYITSTVTWTSNAGYVTFTGTCSTATTAAVILGSKVN